MSLLDSFQKARVASTHLVEDPACFAQTLQSLCKHGDFFVRLGAEDGSEGFLGALFFIDPELGTRDGNVFVDGPLQRSY